MPGTVSGGKRAAQTNMKRHGKNFYQRIGTLGGKKSRNGGFAARRDLARIAGAKGGRKSRRGLMLRCKWCGKCVISRDNLGGYHSWCADRKEQL